MCRSTKGQKGNINTLKKVQNVALFFFSCAFKSVQKFELSLERPLLGE